MFGALGFEEASTRAIADRAGVNLAALHYYFAGKDGVYRACAEHIAAYGEQMIGPFVTQIEDALANPRLTRRQLRTLLRDILDGFADRLVSPHDPPSWVAFVLREQMSPTAAYAVLNERVSGRLIGAVAGAGGAADRSPGGRRGNDPAHPGDVRPADGVPSRPRRRAVAPSAGRISPATGWS